MNSKLRDVLNSFGSDCSFRNLSGEEYKTELDEAEKAIRQAVGEDMLELVDSTMVMNRPVDARFAGGESEVRIKLRQKIKQWQG